MYLFKEAELTNIYQYETPEKRTSRLSGIMYVEYTKVDEAGLSVVMEYSNEVDEDGNEIWHQESRVDAVTGVVSIVEYKFTASGNYRIPVGGSVGDDKVRFGIKSIDEGEFNYGSTSIALRF